MKTENRVVAITGATGGLGRIAVGRFAAQGYRLALISTNLEKLDQLSGELKLPETQFISVVADVSVKNEVQSAVTKILTKFGQVDILLNLVGGWVGGKPVVEVEPEQVELMLCQHLWSTFHLAQGFLPGMLAHHWGRILVVSSPFAAHPNASLAPYVIGKAAQEALMLSIAQEVKGSGVTANMLLVKSIDTNHDRQGDPSPKNSSWTTPEEICASLLYLSSDEASMINGARLPLYGDF
jgi:NAD(P)-dependent dehydrogenase (short-subunit alcohol dehydrogenase family)